MTEPQSPRPLRVRLISSTEHPLETLYYVWEQSRSDRSLPDPSQIAFVLTSQNDQSKWAAVSPMLRELGYIADYKDPGLFLGALGTFKLRFEDTVQMLLTEAVPVTENVSFVFAFENCPITLREQMVRHRIGTQIGPRIGADIIPAGMMEMRQFPDLAESTFWAQTSRVVPMGKFFSEGRYILPDSLEGKTVALETDAIGYTKSCGAGWAYARCMENIENTYNLLVEAGVPLEDARNLIPTGATHNITWGMNLKAMLHIFGKRSSWIAQANIWEEAIAQMIEGLVAVDPIFKTINQPQCIKNGKYIGCPVSGTNTERVQGTDGDMPPCPLWVRYQTGDALKASAFGTSATTLWKADPTLPVDDLRNWQCSSQKSVDMLRDNAKRFGRLWNLDVFDPGLEA